MGLEYSSDIPGDKVETTQIELVLLGDATEEQVIFSAPYACRLKSVSITPDADVAGDNTNRKNLNVVNKGSDGNGVVELGNLDLTAGVDLDQADETTIVALTTFTELAKGDTLALQIEQVGTGVTIPRSKIKVTYDPSLSPPLS